MKYYKELRIELGYDKERNKNYPEIRTVEVLLEHLEFDVINISWSVYGDHCIGLTFECDWDKKMV